MQVLVVHEDEWKYAVVPDVYVTCSQELAWLSRSVYRRSRNVIVLKNSQAPMDMKLDLLHVPDIVGTTVADRPAPVKQLFLPVVSRVFSHTVNHSPVDLLRATPATDSTSSVRRNFAAVGFTCEHPETTEWQPSVEQLEDVFFIDSRGACDTKRHDGRPLFPLDLAVEDLRSFQFVLVKDAVAMVSVFLAGSVPVYYGMSTDALGLFNPAAFVDCSQDESVHKCTKRALELVASSHLIETMRAQPAIVDEVAFTRAFFWHPDALGLHSSAVAKHEQELCFQKLRQILQ